MRFFTPDGSCVDDGRFLLISISRFVNDICSKGCCFICGARPGSVPFNDEHILPNWMLRRHSLHSQQITLPNLSHFRYSGYKIPCCKFCNSRLGQEIETPISAAFARGADGVCEYVVENGPELLFQWLSLVFLKTHLKDSTLRAELRNSGAPTTMIGDVYEWEELHHVHAVARSHESGAKLTSDAMGTLFVMRLKCDAADYFDFTDNYHGRTIGICSGDVAVLAVLNDACAVLSVLAHLLKGTRGIVDPLQFREVFARCTYANIRLKERPVHQTMIDMDTGEAAIVAHHPPLAEVEGIDDAEFGAMMDFYCGDMVERAQLRVPLSPQEIRARVRTGTVTFLSADDVARVP